MAKELIDFSVFTEFAEKVEIRHGMVIEAKRIKEGKRFLQLEVIFGPGESTKTVVTNIGDKFEPGTLKGETFLFITNLAPTKICGVDSEAMIMVSTTPEGLIVLIPTAGDIFL